MLASLKLLAIGWIPGPSAVLLHGSTERRDPGNTKGAAGKNNSRALGASFGEVSWFARKHRPPFDPKRHLDAPLATCDLRANIGIPLLRLDVEYV